MSRKRRRRRNTIAAPAVATKASPPLVVRLAESDLDAAAIHGFLCTVAPRSGALQCEVNPEKSMREVWRVVRALDQAQPGETPYGFALTALIGDKLVGTLGVICPDWWYGDGKFFTDRWFFTLPGVAGVGAALTADADALARDAGLTFLLNLKQRRRGRGSSIVYAPSRKGGPVSDQEADQDVLR